MSEGYEEVWVISAGARLWSASTGSGPAVLFFNGGPGCDDYLGPVAELIDDAYRVIRFEPRGCGRSARDGRYDLDTLVEDGEAVRAAYGVDACVVAGHSFGCECALAYAMAHPAHALGVIAIAGGRIVDDREWSRIYDERRRTRGETSSRRFEADPEVNALGNLAWKAFIKRPLLLRQLADLRVPAVFIAAGDDIRPNWPAEQLANLLPRGRYVEIAHAPHEIWLTNPAELRHELRAALAEMSPVTQVEG